MSHTLSLAAFYLAVERVIADISITIGAFAADFDDGANLRKASMFRRCTHAHSQGIIVNMRCGAAAIANQENAIMQASGMRVGDIGVCAFHAAREVRRHKKV
jgi:hypothetical protein